MQIKEATDQGVTLIELIAVVGIISVLAGVSLVYLSGVRSGGINKSAESQMQSAHAGAKSCMFRGEALTTPVAQSVQCASGSVRWPALPGGWSYGGTVTSDVNTRTYEFSASNGSDTVTCTETGCTTS
jgi:prepilin-type N-terminal cleavage/methylation domain-containing protein